MDTENYTVNLNPEGLDKLCGELVAYAPLSERVKISATPAVFAFFEKLLAYFNDRYKDQLEKPMLLVGLIRHLFNVGLKQKWLETEELPLEYLHLTGTGKEKHFRVSRPTKIYLENHQIAGRGWADLIPTLAYNAAALIYGINFDNIDHVIRRKK